jgi:Response regulators consisting of a CheY-like receiver domain and a winged-helix DNA-binding domain
MIDYLQQRKAISKVEVYPMKSEAYAYNLTINYAAQCAEINGKNIRLTRLEYKTLVYLLERSNIAISRDELLKVIWQLPCQIETRATDDTIKRLRKKLNDHKVKLRIETVRGFGFIIRT